MSVSVGGFGGMKSEQKEKVHSSRVQAEKQTFLRPACIQMGGGEGHPKFEVVKPTKPLRVCNFQNCAFGIISHLLSASLNRTNTRAMQSVRFIICAMVKSRYIGDGHPTFNRNPYNGYINPYYWDRGTYITFAL